MPSKPTPVNSTGVSPAVAYRNRLTRRIMRSSKHVLMYYSNRRPTKAFARSFMCAWCKRGEKELCATISLHTLFRLNLP